MRSARFALVVMTVGALTLAGVLSAQQPKPAKPMQLEKVKDGLFVIRGPFNPCAPNGCGGAYGDDGLLHEGETWQSASRRKGSSSLTTSFRTTSARSSST